MTGIWQATLRDMIEVRGEADVKAELSEFSCPFNKDIEYFIKNKAIEFTKQGLASTHLVYTSYKDAPVLAGYYALANKSVSIKASLINSKRWKSRISKFAEYNYDLKSYIVAMPLIGQLGKNYTNGYNTLISGDQLLEIACEKVRSVQFALSGKLVYLECEDNEKLVDFYTRNGFSKFATRKLDGDEINNDGKGYLLQMIKYFKG